MIRTPIQHRGPLGIDATVTAGTVYPDITIQAPLGGPFQLVLGSEDIDMATFESTAKVRKGPRGTLVYSADLDAAGILRADRVVGA